MFIIILFRMISFLKTCKEMQSKKKLLFRWKISLSRKWLRAHLNPIRRIFNLMIRIAVMMIKLNHLLTQALLKQDLKNQIILKIKIWNSSWRSYRNLLRRDWLFRCFNSLNIIRKINKERQILKILFHFRILKRINFTWRSYRYMTLKTSLNLK